MTRKLKMLGLALAAILAMSAVAASVASAASFELQSETSVITDVDEGIVEFSFTGVGVSCSETIYQGHVTGTSVESITIDPSYKGCKTSLGTEAKITGFGDWGEEASKQCDYLIKASGKLDLSCPAGVEVTWDMASCTVHIPPQSDLGTITYTTGNRLGVHDLIQHLNIQKIKANHTDGLFCPLTGSGESETATLTATTTWWSETVSGVPSGITHKP